MKKFIVLLFFSTLVFCFTACGGGGGGGVGEEGDSSDTASDNDDFTSDGNNGNYVDISGTVLIISPGNEMYLENPEDGSRRILRFYSGGRACLEFYDKKKIPGITAELTDYKSYTGTYSCDYRGGNRNVVEFSCSEVRCVLDLCVQGKVLGRYQVSGTITCYFDDEVESWTFGSTFIEQ